MAKITIPKDKSINIDVLYHTLRANLPNLDYNMYFKNPNKQDKITIRKGNLLVHVKLKEKADSYEIKTEKSHIMLESFTIILLVGFLLWFCQTFFGLIGSGIVLGIIIVIGISAYKGASAIEKEIVEFLNSYEFV